MGKSIGLILEQKKKKILDEIDKIDIVPQIHTSESAMNMTKVKAKQIIEKWL